MGSFPQNADKDFVLCVYAHPNIGQHKVVGAATRRVYGYRGGGDRFYVDRQDIAAQPNLFRIIEEVVKVPEPTQPEIIAPPPEPIVAEVEIKPNIIERDITDLHNVPGVTPGIRAQLNAANVHTVEQLLEFGEEGLKELKGVGEKRAATIIEFAKQYTEKHPAEE